MKFISKMKNNNQLYKLEGILVFQILYYHQKDLYNQNQQDNWRLILYIVKKYVQVLDTTVTAVEKVNHQKLLLRLTMKRWHLIFLIQREVYKNQEIVPLS